MEASKSVSNQTPHTLTVTLYICGRGVGTDEDFGTRRFRLLPGQTLDIGYGDMRHSFLAGVKLECDINGLHVEQKQMITDEDSIFERYLNSSQQMTIKDINLPLMKAV